MERDFGFAKLGEFFLVVIDAEHLVASLSKADAADQADMA